MSSALCAPCVVVLKQQREQNIQSQKEGTGVADNQCQKPKNCTVVENGRVVVKPLQPPLNE
ncbi:hypothetical protein PI95_007590 [Hassallia byssoidea VB512170]|uniref:Uncharacterized protein n=1 Tax=Hassallia byssoidea VB512170 TaxID=1304833 RepID=A0A846H739_9CYAN|nr:hypothetical protein [Hassalia byssoidea]NEU72439.1 hypothetical protein [Hassalia byssoidea VB512170]